MTDSLCYLTINCDTGQHSQFLRCFLNCTYYCVFFFSEVFERVLFSAYQCGASGPPSRHFHIASLAPFTPQSTLDTHLSSHHHLLKKNQALRSPFGPLDPGKHWPRHAKRLRFSCLLVMLFLFVKNMTIFSSWKTNFLSRSVRPSTYNTFSKKEALWKLFH